VKTFNKKGDSGETSLLFGKRVSKSDPRCEAYGTIDEAVSALGVTRNYVTKDKTKEIIIELQKELFIVAAEMATKPEEQERLDTSFQRVTDGMVDRIEEMIVDLENEITMPKAFTIPGSNTGSAWLDLSRAIVRRAERKATLLRESGETENNAISSYLNRLADLLFTLARYEEL